MPTGYILLNSHHFTEGDRKTIATAITTLADIPDGLQLSADPTPSLDLLLNNAFPALEAARHTHPQIAEAIDVIVRYRLGKILLRARNIVPHAVQAQVRVKVVLGKLSVGGYLDYNLTERTEPRAKALQESLIIMSDDEDAE